MELGARSTGVCRVSVGLASCSFEGRTGEILEKEIEREVGTLGVGLPDALRLTWGVGLPGAVLAGAGQQDHPRLAIFAFWAGLVGEVGV